MASSSSLQCHKLPSHARVALTASKLETGQIRATRHHPSCGWSLSRQPSRCCHVKAGARLQRQLQCAGCRPQRRRTSFFDSVPKVKDRENRGAIHAMAGPYTTRETRIEQAAQQAVDFFVAPNQVVGLGTGPGCTLAAEHLGRRLKEGKLWNVKAVPVSADSAAALAQAGIPLTTAESQKKIDVMLEDPDLVQEGTLSFILGRRGVPGGWGDKSILKERELAPLVEQYILIADSREFVGKLQGTIPVVVQAEDWEETAEELDDLFLGDAEIWRRPTSGKAGPMGGDQPLVTDQGHFVLDVLFTEPIADVEQVVSDLQSVPGVVGHGLFVNTAYAVAVGKEDGVKIRTSLFKEAFRKSVTQ